MCAGGRGSPGKGVLTGRPNPLRSRRSVENMDNRAEVREFLITRRAKISPAQAGLADIGPRRVPGLRRGEVAALAGVSIEYYSKLERGSLAGVSSLRPGCGRARPAARRRRAGPPVPPRRRRRRHQRDHAATPPHPPSAGRHGRACNGPWMRSPPARPFVRNGRMDLLATNHLGRAMHASLYDGTPSGPADFARYTFLERGLPPVLPGLGRRRRHLRRHPAHRSRPRPLRQGTPRSRRGAVHPQRGLRPPLEQPQRPSPRRRGPSTSTTRSSATSTLAYESLELVAEPGLTMTIYAAEPNSPIADALSVLASWAASHTRAEVQRT